MKHRNLLLLFCSLHSLQCCLIRYGDAFNVTPKLPQHQHHSRKHLSSSVLGVLCLSNTDNNDDDAEETAKKLRDEAERLRSEVQSFEKKKIDEERKQQKEEQKIIQERQDLRNRYSATVPILKQDGNAVMERVDFPPRYKDGTTEILTCEIPLPMGIVLGEHETIPGAICIDEILEGSNGEESGCVQVGDLLRACTACQMSMETPTWQIIAGGIGRPKTKRFMFATDNIPFEEVMESLGSNRMDPDERPVVLVLERRAK